MLMDVRTNGHEDDCRAGWMNALSLGAGAKTHGLIHRQRRVEVRWAKFKVQEIVAGVASFLRIACCPHPLIPGGETLTVHSPQTPAGTAHEARKARPS